MRGATLRGWVFLCALLVVVIILVYIAEFNVSPEFTKLLAPASAGGLVFGNFLGFQIGFLTVAYDAPMVVVALALGYLTFKVKRREYRLLFVIFIIFALLHLVYHGVLATGNQTRNSFLVRLARDLIDPVDIWILAAFGMLYLRREIRVGG